MDQDPPAAGQEAAAGDEEEAAALAPVRREIVFVHSAAIKARTSGERPAFSKHAQSAAQK